MTYFIKNKKIKQIKNWTDFIDTSGGPFKTKLIIDNKIGDPFIEDLYIITKLQIDAIKKFDPKKLYNFFKENTSDNTKFQEMCVENFKNIGLVSNTNFTNMNNNLLNRLEILKKNIKLIIINYIIFNKIKININNESKFVKEYSESINIKNVYSTYFVNQLDINDPTKIENFLQDIINKILPIMLKNYKGYNKKLNGTDIFNSTENYYKKYINILTPSIDYLTYQQIVLIIKILKKIIDKLKIDIKSKNKLEKEIKSYITLKYLKKYDSSGNLIYNSNSNIDKLIKNSDEDRYNENIQNILHNLVNSYNEIYCLLKSLNSLNQLLIDKEIFKTTIEQNLRDILDEKLCDIKKTFDNYNVKISECIIEIQKINNDNKNFIVYNNGSNKTVLYEFNPTPSKFIEDIYRILKNNQDCLNKKIPQFMENIKLLLVKTKLGSLFSYIKTSYNKPSSISKFTTPTIEEYILIYFYKEKEDKNIIELKQLLEKTNKEIKNNNSPTLDKLFEKYFREASQSIPITNNTKFVKVLTELQIIIFKNLMKKFNC